MLSRHPDILCRLDRAVCGRRSWISLHRRLFVQQLLAIRWEANANCCSKRRNWEAGRVSSANCGGSPGVHVPVVTTLRLPSPTRVIWIVTLYMGLSFKYSLRRFFSENREQVATLHQHGSSECTAHRVRFRCAPRDRACPITSNVQAVPRPCAARWM